MSRGKRLAGFYPKDSKLETGTSLNNHLASIGDKDIPSMSGWIKVRRFSWSGVSNVTTLSWYRLKAGHHAMNEEIRVRFLMLVSH